MRRSWVRFSSWAPFAATVCWHSSEAGDANIEHLLNICLKTVHCTAKWNIAGFRSSPLAPNLTSDETSTEIAVRSKIGCMLRLGSSTAQSVTVEDNSGLTSTMVERRNHEYEWRKSSRDSIQPRILVAAVINRSNHRIPSIITCNWCQSRDEWHWSDNRTKVQAEMDSPANNHRIVVLDCPRSSALEVWLDKGNTHPYCDSNSNGLNGVRNRQGRRTGLSGLATDFTHPSITNNVCCWLMSSSMQLHRKVELNKVNPS